MANLNIVIMFVVKETVMQIEKTLINDRLREKYPVSLVFQLFITLQYFTLRFAIFL